MNVQPSLIHKILFINLAYIGDVVLSTPLTRALQQAYPSAAIDMLVIPGTAGVAAGNPHIQRVIPYDKRGRHKNLANLWQLIRQLRRQRYDLAVTSNFSLRSAVIAWASGARWRAGFDAQHAPMFLTHVAASQRSSVRHETLNQLDVLKPLGIDCDNTELAYRLNPADNENLRQKILLPAERPLVVICPFGRDRLKSWSLSHYAALLKKFSVSASCLLIGGVNERDGLEEINVMAGQSARILAGEITLGELAALLAQAQLMVTVDTGPMHIAAAVGTPIVALFGRTDSRVWGPRGEGNTVIKLDLPCMPCENKVCYSHQCMRDLPMEPVVDACMKVLANGGG